MQKVAPLSATVLILGESGTGKELLARLHPPRIGHHRRAVRRGQPRGHPEGTARERALRAREGRVHGRGPPPHRSFRAGRRRDVVPGRGRRATAGRAGQAVARVAGRGDHAGRRVRDKPRGRTTDRRDPSRSRGRASAPAASATISTSESTWCLSICRLCANAVKTSSRWRACSSIATRDLEAVPRATSRLLPSTGFGLTSGRGTSASWRT